MVILRVCCPAKHQADCHAQLLLASTIYDNVTLAILVLCTIMNNKFRIPNHKYYENEDPQIFGTFLGPLDRHFHKEIGDIHVHIH